MWMGRIVPKAYNRARFRPLRTGPIVLLNQGLINVGLGAFGVLYNLYLTALGQPLSFIGAFNAITILAIGVSAVLVGVAARLVSRMQALILGTLLLVIVQIVLALITTPAILLSAGVVSGVAQGLCVAPVAPL